MQYKNEKLENNIGCGQNRSSCLFYAFNSHTLFPLRKIVLQRFYAFFIGLAAEQLRTLRTKYFKVVCFLEVACEITPLPCTSLVWIVNFFLLSREIMVKSQS